MTASRQFSTNYRWYGWAAIGITLVALGVVVLWGRQKLRDEMRAQIIGRDATILHALAQREQSNPTPEFQDLDPRESEFQMGTLLRMASLTNIIAARLFRPDGSFEDGLPPHVKESTLDEETLARLDRGETVARFVPAAPLDRLFLMLPDPQKPAPATIAWVEINVPLAEPGEFELVGVAQFLLEGFTTQRALDRLDSRLNRQSALVFCVVAGLVSASLGWAFRRVERANRLLAARTIDLQHANQELAEAAKITAVGAVAAHLIHSLKNPVAGLQSFVVARQDQAAEGEGEEWREALAATRRMQALIQQVVQVLREQEQAAAYSLSLQELGEAVLAQTRALAERQGVRLSCICVSATAELDNRAAGILRLILTNLVQNAIEASASGHTVNLCFTENGTSLQAEVADQGAGISESVRAHLFQPVRSRKDGGSGIGLAISRQLANHLGADLKLTATSERGTTFSLRWPRTQALT